jgi:hypothetical protein
VHASRGEKDLRLTLQWFPLRGPGDVQVRDLLDLTALEVDDPHEKLTQLYLWKYDYGMTGAKAITAAGASLFIGLIVAILQAKPHTDIKPEVVGMVSAGVIMLIGILRYLSLQAISRQFMSAHYLLSDVSRLKPFLQRYRSEAES